MIFLIVIVASISAFCLGFILGSKEEPKKGIVDKLKWELENQQLAEEYRNFLNYDGTEQ